MDNQSKRFLKLELPDRKRNSSLITKGHYLDGTKYSSMQWSESPWITSNNTLACPPVWDLPLNDKSQSSPTMDQHCRLKEHPKKRCFDDSMKRSEHSTQSEFSRGNRLRRSNSVVFSLSFKSSQKNFCLLKQDGDQSQMKGSGIEAWPSSCPDACLEVNNEDPQI